MKEYDEERAVWITIITGCILVTIILIVSMIIGCAPKPEPIKPDPHNGYWIIHDVITKTNWVFSFGLLATAGGIFAFLNGKPIGLKIISTATALISIYFMYAKYSTWVAIGGVIGSVILVGYSIYDQYRQHRIKDAALSEIVMGNDEFLKCVEQHVVSVLGDFKNELIPGTFDALKPALVKEIMDLFKHKQNNIQSIDTTKIVETVKNGGVK